jgi:hypothetical protein
VNQSLLSNYLVIRYTRKLQDIVLKITFISIFQLEKKGNMVLNYWMLRQTSVITQILQAKYYYIGQIAMHIMSINNGNSVNLIPLTCFPKNLRKKKQQKQHALFDGYIDFDTNGNFSTRLTKERLQ